MGKLEMGKLEVGRFRHMRIDFNLIPVKGRVTYSVGLEDYLSGKVEKLIGEDNVQVEIAICPGEYKPYLYPQMLRCRTFSGKKLEKQLRHGDHGYILIRGLDDGFGFGFVDRYPGDDWNDKFRNARQSLIHDLNCTLYNNGSQLLVTHLNPSQDARLFSNLLSSSSTPTLVLKRLPTLCCYYSPYKQSLLNFFRSLTKTREPELDVEFDAIRGKVSIQFKNYNECYKALQKLCSHSLKLNEEEVVVYDLTLKDNSLVSNVFDEVLCYKYNGYKAYSESATTQALNNRVAMLEKEFNIVKDMTENSKIVKGSAGARALKYRGAMLEKRLDIVISVMKEFGAAYNESPSTQALRNRVSALNNELSTIKPVLKDASIGKIKALETRVAMLEKELKTMKDDGMMSKKRKKKDGINESAGACV